MNGKVSTKKLSDGFILIQIDGRTMQGLWTKSYRGEKYYESDTFPRKYKTISEAKSDTLSKFNNGHWNKKFERSNPKPVKLKHFRKRLASSRKLARAAFRAIRVGKLGGKRRKPLRAGCPRGRWDGARCALGMMSRGAMYPKKYIGIAQMAIRKNAAKPMRLKK